MKIIHTILLLGALLSLTACNTTRVQTQLDLSAPMTVFVLDGNDEIQPDSASQSMIIQLLKDWLPEMRSTVSTYPTPVCRIKVAGFGINGPNIEEIIFVGSNWIGDGTGIATLADTQAFKLNRVLDTICTNRLKPKI